MATPEATPTPQAEKKARAGSTKTRRSAKKAAGSNGAIEGLDAKELLAVLNAVHRGDFSARLVVESNGTAARIADTLNAIIERNDQLTQELERVAEAVGNKGRIAERAALTGASGCWRKAVDSVNELVTSLVQPVTEIERVIGAVAKGDLSQKMEMEVEGRAIRGEFLRTAKMVNTMVDQLSSFASEVTRVAREVGSEGKLGGQARVKGVSGTWKMRQPVYPARGAVRLALRL